MDSSVGSERAVAAKASAGESPATELLPLPELEEVARAALGQEEYALRLEASESEVVFARLAVVCVAPARRELSRCVRVRVHTVEAPACSLLGRWPLSRRG